MPFAVFLLAAAVTGGTARAREEPADLIPDDPELERRSAVIGEIDVVVGNVFDLSDP